MSVGALLLISVIMTIDLYCIGLLIKLIKEEKKLKKVIKIYNHRVHELKKKRYKRFLRDWLYCYSLTDTMDINSWYPDFKK